MTSYYDVALKERRIAILRRSNAFAAQRVMLEDAGEVRETFERAAPDVVFHLAAQAGVRYSLENPRAYIEANLVGTFNVMELVRELHPRHFLLASTSSVYGANEAMPFKEVERADHPLTLYAATKKATEGMAHSYAHLWSLPTTAFRFFTVYGPWGRPDMALFKFVKAILDDRRSRSTGRAPCGATSPISTISSKPSSALQMRCRSRDSRSIPRSIRSRPPLRTGSSTSRAANPSGSSSSSR